MTTQAAEPFGVLDCDTIHAQPIDVDWSEAFGDERAEIVYPDFSELPLADVMSYIEKRDIDADFAQRLAGLDEDDAAELAALDEKALRGPIIRSDPFPHRLDAGEFDRMKELRYERDNSREEEDDIREEIDERAQELAQEAPEEFEPMMSCAYPLGSLRGSTPETLQARLLPRGPLVVVLLDETPYLALAGGGMDFSWEICEAYALLGFRPPLHFCDLPRMAGRGESDGDRAIIAACIGSAEIARGWAQSAIDRLQNDHGPKA